MVWRHADALTARLKRYAHRGWIEGINGGLAVCHQPERGPLAYLFRTYPGLSDSDLAATERYYSAGVPSACASFLQHSNGCHLFDCLTLFGSLVRPDGHALLNRDPRDVIGQPISLDHGNVWGMPEGLPAGTFVVGVLSGYSGQGKLVIVPSGEVLLTHLEDGSDIAARWATFETMLFSEFDRLAELHDQDGELLVETADRLPEAARRWETSPVVHRNR